MTSPKHSSRPVFVILLLACLFLLASASPIVQLPRDNDVIIDFRDGVDSDLVSELLHVLYILKQGNAKQRVYRCAVMEETGQQVRWGYKLDTWVDELHETNEDSCRFH
ncbi:hypothetical protein AZE42_10930 [Rhizopogon vesiculosus]|uniref:Uncharacterized protein n=1 Tax=Rhizopogon vesiculosus TaxID=180088 RepID=A0A1J8QDV3_9AGAM|nr:hypothetical protein AZE42_10930 [Rhizopogon vesiculosus]